MKKCLDQTVSDFIGAEKVLWFQNFSWLTPEVFVSYNKDRWSLGDTVCSFIIWRVWCGRSVEDADDDLFIIPFGHLPSAELRVRGSGQ